MSTLVKLSVPFRLQKSLMTKEAFDIPDSTEGHKFMAWWERARPNERDGVMKIALDRNISVVDALKAKDDDEEAE